MTTFALNEAMVQSVSRLVDDAGATREPSHSDIESVLRTAGLLKADPHRDPTIRVGKQKRVRRVLSWSLDNDPAAGVRLTTSLIAMVRGCGGFRPNSPNYCGDEAIETCVAAFVGEPVELTTDGLLRPRRLDALSGRELSQALRSYVARAQRGHADSVLVVGTDKDLMEAVAAHVLSERFGSYSEQANFPTLLGQAFAAVGLDINLNQSAQGGIDGARTDLNTRLYDLGVAVNRLRNRAGSGHGRPFVPSLSEGETRAATEAAGLVAGRLLDELDS